MRKIGKDVPVAGIAYCVACYEAVAALRAHGFRVRRLEDGLPEWRAAGLPVDTTAVAASS